MAHLRVYLEDFSEEKAIWAVDEGDAQTVKFFDHVCVHAFGITKFNMGSDNKDEPRAWLEFEGATLKIIEDTAVIR